MHIRVVHQEDQRKATLTEKTKRTQCFGSTQHNSVSCNKLKLSTDQEYAKSQWLIGKIW